MEPQPVTEDPAGPADGVTNRLEPYVAWLATRIGDEATRRRYREVAEAFLRFSAADRGAPGTRGQRFVVAHRDRAAPETTRAAMERLVEYDAVVRCTLPFDT